MEEGAGKNEELDLVKARLSNMYCTANEVRNFDKQMDGTVEEAQHFPIVRVNSDDTEI